MVVVVAATEVVVVVVFIAKKVVVVVEDGFGLEAERVGLGRRNRLEGRLRDGQEEGGVEVMEGREVRGGEGVVEEGRGWRRGGWGAVEAGGSVKSKRGGGGKRLPGKKGEWRVVGKRISTTSTCLHAYRI